MSEKNKRKLYIALFISSCCALIIAIVFVLFGKPIHSEFFENLKYLDNDSVRSLDFNKKNYILTVGYESGILELHDTTQKGVFHKIKAHEYRVSNVTTSSDGTLALTSSYFENETKVWNVTEGKFVRSIPRTNGPEIIAQDNKTFFLADNQEIRIYDYLTETFCNDHFKSNGVIQSFSLSNDNKYLAVGTTGGVQIWEVLKRSKEISLELMSTVRPYDQSNWIVNVQFSKIGKKLLTISRSGMVDSWQVPSLQNRKSYPTAIKNVSSSLIFGERLGTVVVFGTLNARGSGEGYGHEINLGKGPSKTIIKSLTNLPIATFIPSSKTILIANYKKYYPLNYEKY